MVAGLRSPANEAGYSRFSRTQFSSPFATMNSWATAPSSPLYFHHGLGAEPDRSCRPHVARIWRNRSLPGVQSVPTKRRCRIQDFQEAGKPPERNEVRFLKTFRRTEDGRWVSLMAHRDIKPFDGKGQYIRKYMESNP